jgi:hypothetical protein
MNTPINTYQNIQAEAERDRAERISAALEVDALIQRNRRIDAAPDDDDLAGWTEAAWFFTGWTAFMGLSFWLAFTASGHALLAAIWGVS